MTAPSHVVADPCDQRSLCGMKNPLPVLAAFAVHHHQRRRDFTVCGDCADRLAEVIDQAIRESLEAVYSGDQSLEAGALLDQLGDRGYRVVKS